jgi:hypothetical protein
VLSPEVGATRGLLLLGLGGAVGDRVVQDHDHIASQRQLSPDYPLWGDADRVSAVGGPKGDRPVVQLHQLVQTHQLIAATVGQDGPAPSHEAVQAPQLGDQLHPGPQGQVIEVRQQHLGPRGSHLVGVAGPDAGMGSHRHEGRGLHLSMGGPEDGPSSSTVPGQNREGGGPSAQIARQPNMQSPKLRNRYPQASACW